MLNHQDKSMVRKLAGGDNAVRADAESVYLANVRDHVDGGRKSCEMNFLSEVFNKCPDYMLKAIYRKQVLAQKA